MCCTLETLPILDITQDPRGSGAPEPLPMVVGPALLDRSHQYVAEKSGLKSGEIHGRVLPISEQIGVGGRCG